MPNKKCATSSDDSSVPLPAETRRRSRKRRRVERREFSRKYYKRKTYRKKQDYSDTTSSSSESDNSSLGTVNKTDEFFQFNKKKLFMFFENFMEIFF